MLKHMKQPNVDAELAAAAKAWEAKFTEVTSREGVASCRNPRCIG